MLATNFNREGRIHAHERSHQVYACLLGFVRQCSLPAAQGFASANCTTTTSVSTRVKPSRFPVPRALDVTGWRVVLYNGANGLVYNTSTLSGIIPATCGARGVVVINYPVNGIQNGSPDGLALVDASGTVRGIPVLRRRDDGRRRSGRRAARPPTSASAKTAITPVGHVAGARPDGTWAPSAANTFGACNDSDPTPPRRKSSA